MEQIKVLVFVGRTDGRRKYHYADSIFTKIVTLKIKDLFLCITGLYLIAKQSQFYRIGCDRLELALIKIATP